MKIELTINEAIQLIKEHLGTSNSVEICITEQITKDEDKERNNRSTVIKTPVQEESEKETRELLVNEVKMLLKQGNKMGAVKLVNQSIADIGLKRAKLFVEMDEREFECFIEIGSCPIN